MPELSELFLRKCCPGVSLINTNLPKIRISMINSTEENELLSDNNTDIFEKSIIDGYMDCLTSAKFACLKNVCLAQFASHYQKNCF